MGQALHDVKVLARDAAAARRVMGTARSRLEQLAMSRGANWQFMLATNCIESCSCHAIQTLRSNVETCSSRIQQLHDSQYDGAGSFGLEACRTLRHGMISAVLRLSGSTISSQLHCRTSSSSQPSYNPCQSIGLGARCLELPDKPLKPIRATCSVSNPLRDFSAGLNGHAPGRFGHAGRLGRLASHQRNVPLSPRPTRL